METSEALITLHGAAFGYNRQPVIRNVSLTVHRGEFIGLIGPNGAGKSTLFKGMLKLLPPISGDVIHSPAIAQHIGYVPQRDQLDAIYPLVAGDVVRMGMMGFRPPATMIRECLKGVGMEAYQDHPFAELSGGQRQRILIARALAVQPHVLVLDEPTAGIDPAAEESILAILTELHQRQGVAILMVSHHVAILRGRVSRIATVDNHEIASEPGSNP